MSGVDEDWDVEKRYAEIVWWQLASQAVIEYQLANESLQGFRIDFQNDDPRSQSPYPYYKLATI